MGTVKERQQRMPPPAFVIALWLERGERPDRPEWRWRVIEVRTAERRYFRRLDDVLRYVSQKAGVSPPA